MRNDLCISPVHPKNRLLVCFNGFHKWTDELKHTAVQLAEFITGKDKAEWSRNVLAIPSSGEVPCAVQYARDVESSENLTARLEQSVR